MSTVWHNVNIGNWWCQFYRNNDFINNVVMVHIASIKIINFMIFGIEQALFVSSACPYLKFKVTQ